MDEEKSVDYVVDSVNVQIVIAKMEDRHKVAETTFNPVKLLYPFDLGSLCEQAVEQAVAQEQAANAGS